jgi:hypothetical protein
VPPYVPVAAVTINVVAVPPATAVPALAKRKPAATPATNTSNASTVDRLLFLCILQWASIP